MTLFKAILLSLLLLCQTSKAVFRVRDDDASSSTAPDAITAYPEPHSEASSSSPSLTPDGFSWDATGIDGPIHFYVYDPKLGLHLTPSFENGGYQGLSLDPVMDSPTMYSQAQANRNHFRQSGGDYKDKSANAWTRRQALLRLAKLDLQSNELGAIDSKIDNLVFYNPLKFTKRVEEDFEKQRLPILEKDPIDGQLVLRQPHNA